MDFFNAGHTDALDFSYYGDVKSKIDGYINKFSPSGLTYTNTQGFVPAAKKLADAVNNPNYKGYNLY